MGPTVIRTFEERDRASVIDLWRHAELLRAWNDPDKDIDRKPAVSSDPLFVATLDDEAQP